MRSFKVFSLLLAGLFMVSFLPAQDADAVSDQETTLPASAEETALPDAEAAESESATAESENAAKKDFKAKSKTSTKATTASAATFSVTAGVETTFVASNEKIEFKPEVSDSGSFCYSYPIELPSGTNGMAPSLSIEYSSAGGNGILGIGFRLTGLPVIERDASYPITFTGSDHYTLDGQKLIFDSLGPTEKKFHLEREDYSKIQAFLESDPSTPINDPNDAGTFWVVTKKDGTKYFFGQTDDSRIDAIGKNGLPRFWALNKVQDVHGNYWEVDYEESQSGFYYPTTIRYTLGGDQSAYTNILFYYVSRTDIYGTFAPTSMSIDKRLDRIEVLTNCRSESSGVIRSGLKFGYANAAVSGQSLLSSITRIGEKGIVGIPPAEFKWLSHGNNPAYQYLRSYSSLCGTENSLSSNVLMSADFTGDGKTDIARIYSISPPYSPTTYHCSVFVWDVDDFKRISNQSIDLRDGTAGDINGDGRADIVRQKTESIYTGSFAPSHYRTTLECYLFTGSAFSLSSTIVVSDYTSSEGPPVHSLWVVDVNGDGKADILDREKRSNSSITWKYYLSNGAGFSSAQAFQANVPLEVEESLIMDFDGDGAIDLIGRVPGRPYNPGWIYMSSGTISTGYYNYFKDKLPVALDVNGDGRLDLIDKNKVYTIANGIQCLFEVPFGGLFSSGTAMLSVSFNNDEFDDVLVQRAFNTNIFDFYVSTGNALVNTGFYLGQCCSPADYNGDGKSEFIVSNLSTPLYLNVGGFPNLVNRVINHTKGEISVEYAPAPQMPGVINPGTSSYPSVSNKSTDYIVKKVTFKSGFAPGADPDVVYEYSYEGRKTLAGLKPDRRDLGFAAIERKTAGTNVYVRTEYYQNAPLQGLVKKVVSGSKTPFGYVNEILTNAYSATPVMTGVSFIKLDDVTKEIKNGGTIVLKSEKTTYAYDVWGNVSQENYFNPATSTEPLKTTTTEYAVCSTSYVVRPFRAIVQMKDISGDMGETSRVITYYDDSEEEGIVGPRGLATRVVTENGDDDIVQEFGYDQYGNVTGKRDANACAANSTTFTETIIYDPDYHADVKIKTNALNQTESIEYDDYRRPKFLTVIDGTKTFVFYDSFGRPAEEGRVIGDIELILKKHEYNDTNVPLYHKESLRTGTAEWNQIAISYSDGFGRIKKTRRSSGKTGASWIDGDTFYDAGGRIAAETKPYPGAATPSWDASLPKTAIAYDIFGRPSTITNPDTTTVRYKYTGFGTIIVDEDGHYEEAWENAFTTKKIRYTDIFPAAPGTPYSTITTNVYRGSAVTTDQAGNAYVSTFDMAGRKKGYSDGDIGSWTYGYDPNGNITSQKDAIGLTTSFEYDDLNRIKRKNLANGDIIIYNYDEPGHGPASTGKVTSVLYPKGRGNSGLNEDSYIYDDRGRLASLSRTIDGNTRAVYYAYDDQDRMITMTYPGGETVTTAYGDDGVAYSLSGTEAYVSDTTFTPWGALGSISFGNGITQAYGYYDSAATDPKTGFSKSYRLSGMTVSTSGTSPATLLSIGYSYYQSGLMYRKTDAQNAALTMTYAYDTLDRVTSMESTQTGTHTYAYDVINNLTEKDGIAYTYGDAAKPHRLTARGAESFDYDLNGNILTRGADSFVYDVSNRIVTSTVDGVTSAYEYDAGGQRTKKSTGSTTTYYFFPGYQETYSAGALTETTKYYSFNGQRIAQRTIPNGTGTGEVQYLHTDYLGSVVGITDAAQALVKRQEYQAYGSDAYVTGTATTKYQYTGQEKDTADLYYYNARYYDPELGRFLQPDPAIWDGTLNVDLSLEERLNAYMYCGNDPVNSTDPDGQMFINTQIGAALGALGGAIKGIRNEINDKNSNMSLEGRIQRVAVMTITGAAKGAAVGLTVDLTVAAAAAAVVSTIATGGGAVPVIATVAIGAGGAAAVAYFTGLGASAVEQSMYEGKVDAKKMESDALTDAAYAAGGAALQGASAASLAAAAKYAFYARNATCGGLTEGNLPAPNAGMYGNMASNANAAGNATAIASDAVNAVEFASQGKEDE